MKGILAFIKVIKHCKEFRLIKLKYILYIIQKSPVCQNKKIIKKVISEKFTPKEILIQIT